MLVLRALTGCVAGRAVAAALPEMLLPAAGALAEHRPQSVDERGAALQPVRECGNLTDHESELHSLINSYRRSNGLGDVPLSRALSTAAQVHLFNNQRIGPRDGCSMHSYLAPPLPDESPYTQCCYGGKEGDTKCMWGKPEQITGDCYPSSGYEISTGGISETDPQAVLDMWKSSSSHNDIILNNGVWVGFPWQALGVAMGEGYSHAIFGTIDDACGTC